MRISIHDFFNWVFLMGLILSLCCLEINAQAYKEVKTTYIDLDKINQLISNISGNELKGLKDGMILDANKDGIKDIAVIVELTSPTISSLSNMKRLLTNFKIQYLCERFNNCADEVELKSPAFLIIHGANKSWKINDINNFRPKNLILFRGRENIMSFQRSRLDRNEDTMNVFLDKNGIGFDFGTEASEGYLQFRKGKYHWYETEP